jgi:hypothetical protein
MIKPTSPNLSFLTLIQVYLFTLTRTSCDWTFRGFYIVHSFRYDIFLIVRQQSYAQERFVTGNSVLGHFVGTPREVDTQG